MSRGEQGCRGDQIAPLSAIVLLKLGDSKDKIIGVMRARLSTSFGKFKEAFGAWRLSKEYVHIKQTLVSQSRIHKISKRHGIFFSFCRYWLAKWLHTVQD